MKMTGWRLAAMAAAALVSGCATLDDLRDLLPAR